MNLRESPSRPASEGWPGLPEGLPRKALGTLREPQPPSALWLLVLLLAVLLAAPGCSGCNWGGSGTTAKAKGKDDKKDDKKRDELEESELEKKRTKKKEKPKDDFEPL